MQDGRRAGVLDLNADVVIKNLAILNEPKPAFNYQQPGLSAFAGPAVLNLRIAARNDYDVGVHVGEDRTVLDPPFCAVMKHNAAATSTVNLAVLDLRISA